MFNLSFTNGTLPGIEVQILTLSNSSFLQYLCKNSNCSSVPPLDRDWETIN